MSTSRIQKDVPSHIFVLYRQRIVYTLAAIPAHSFMHEQKPFQTLLRHRSTPSTIEGRLAKKLQISEFELTQPAIDDSELGNESSFPEWLEQPPDAAKFCFPSTKAGADLAFVLNRNSPQVQAAHPINRILVTVQVCSSPSTYLKIPL